MTEQPTLEQLLGLFGTVSQKYEHASKFTSDYVKNPTDGKLIDAYIKFIAPSGTTEDVAKTMANELKSRSPMVISKELGETRKQKESDLIGITSQLYAPFVKDYFDGEHLMEIAFATSKEGRKANTLKGYLEQKNYKSAKEIVLSYVSPQNTDFARALKTLMDSDKFTADIAEKIVLERKAKFQMQFGREEIVEGKKQMTLDEAALTEYVAGLPGKISEESELPEFYLTVAKTVYSIDKKRQEEAEKAAKKAAEEARTRAN